MVQKESKMRTELKRWTITESRWNRNEVSRESPETLLLLLLLFTRTPYILNMFDSFNTGKMAMNRIVPVQYIDCIVHWYSGLWVCVCVCVCVWRTDDVAGLIVQEPQVWTRHACRHCQSFEVQCRQFNSIQFNSKHSRDSRVTRYQSFSSSQFVTPNHAATNIDWRAHKTTGMTITVPLHYLCFAGPSVSIALATIGA